MRKYYYNYLTTYLNIDMLRVGMLLSCIFMTNSALYDEFVYPTKLQKREVSQQHDNFAVTCYICVNVSDNLICNQFAIDKPCKPGETFCHTLHIMDSKGTSVLVNKKCTDEIECQRSRVGCVEIDAQIMCVSCCDENYCNKEVPTNASSVLFDNKITMLRKHAKNMFREKEKALTTTFKDAAKGSQSSLQSTSALLALLFIPLFINT